MPSVRVRENEYFDAALRRFKRACEKAGILTELRRREFYEKPTQERKRKKAASRKFRGPYGHTPLSAEEDIPWRCRRLVIGTGADGALPVMQQVRDEARGRKVDLIVLPTAQAIGVLAKAGAHTNAILHLTC